jgi:hypothetical protein
VRCKTLPIIFFSFSLFSFFPVSFLLATRKAQLCKASTNACGHELEPARQHSSLLSFYSSSAAFFAASMFLDRSSIPVCVCVLCVCVCVCVWVCVCVGVVCVCVCTCM